jgi:hypothetical protein
MKTVGLPTESVLSLDVIVGVLMNFNLCSFCVVVRTNGNGGCFNGMLLNDLGSE